MSFDDRERHMDEIALLNRQLERLQIEHDNLSPVLKRRKNAIQKQMKRIQEKIKKLQKGL